MSSTCLIAGQTRRQRIGHFGRCCIVAIVLIGVFPVVGRLLVVAPGRGRRCGCTRSCCRMLAAAELRAVVFAATAIHVGDLCAGTLRGNGGLCLRGGGRGGQVRRSRY